MFLNNILDITWSTARNAIVYDTDSKPYICFTSGIFAANIGHNNPYVTEAIKRQAHLIHCYTYQHELRERYIAELCEFTGYEAAALFSAGTEATEAAWKICRKKTGINPVWGLGSGAFHGKTLGAQIMAGRFNSTLYAQPRDNTCMFIMEPYRALDATFWTDKTISKYRGFQNDGLLTTVDEIQSGFGRTGKLFGFQHYDLFKPDLVCIGKGMGNGFPLSGVLGPKELIEEPFMDLSSTHGGNPLACSVGLAVIKCFKENDIIAEAERKGRILHSALESFPILTFGKGMVAGLVFDKVSSANDFVVMAAEKGVLVVHTGANTVKLGPPLTIPDDQLKDGLAILKECAETIMDKMK